MILFATDTDNFKPLAKSAMEEAHRPPVKHERPDYGSMAPFYSIIAERHAVLDRMNEHAHREPEYFWANLNR